jgi:WD40 repeat protein
VQVRQTYTAVCRLFTLAAFCLPSLLLKFDHESNLLLSSSADGTCRVWDVKSGRSIFKLADHTDEVTDATFDAAVSAVVC